MITRGVLCKVPPVQVYNTTESKLECLVAHSTELLVFPLQANDPHLEAIEEGKTLMN